MKKKLYSAPRVEALFMGSLGSIMKTSIGMDNNNLPEEPSSAPKKRNEVF